MWAWGLLERLDVTDELFGLVLGDRALRDGARHHSGLVALHDLLVGIHDRVEQVRRAALHLLSVGQLDRRAEEPLEGRPAGGRAVDRVAALAAHRDVQALSAWRYDDVRALRL